MKDHNFHLATPLLLSCLLYLLKQTLILGGALWRGLCGKELRKASVQQLTRS